jgi:KDO2-lipid IV(A) lauroyltransferase
MIAAGHHNNYEMGAASLALQVGLPVAAIYAPLQNPYFDERIRETRGKFGLYLWPRGQVTKRAKEWAKEGKAFGIGFAFDQSPHAAKAKFWMPFFGRLTAVAPGLEVYAKRYDSAVIYINLERVSRGRYQYYMHLITENPRDQPSGAILREVNQRFEAVLRDDPVGWLWSHRRWKLDISRDLTERDEVFDAQGRPISLQEFKSSQVEKK